MDVANNQHRLWLTRHGYHHHREQPTHIGFDCAGRWKSMSSFLSTQRRRLTLYRMWKRFGERHGCSGFED